MGCHICIAATVACPTMCKERLLQTSEGNFAGHILGPAPLQKCVGDFCGANIGGFCRGFSWRIFLGTFSPQKLGEKIRRQHPRKNPAAQKWKSRKICSAKNRPHKKSWVNFTGDSFGGMFLSFYLCFLFPHLGDTLSSLSWVMGIVECRLPEITGCGGQIRRDFRRQDRFELLGSHKSMKRPLRLAKLRCRWLSPLSPPLCGFHCRPHVRHLKMDAAFLLTVGSFLLTVELFYLQLTSIAFLLTVGAFLLTVLAFLLTVGVFLLTVP